MNVFITGASGYIGFQVALRFAKAGYRVFGHLRKKEKAPLLWQNEVIPWIKPLEELSQDIDIAIDCSGADFQKSQKIVETLLRQKPKVFLYTSGVWVYGNSNEKLLETSPLSPLDIVSWRPHIEKLALAYPHTIIIRPAHVYGLRGALTNLLFSEAKKGCIDFVKGIDNFWSFIHVLDLAELYFLAAEKKIFGETINGVEGKSLPLKAIIEKIAEVSHAKIKLGSKEEFFQKHGPLAEGLLIDQKEISGRKAKNLLGLSCRKNDLIEEMEFYWNVWNSYQT